MNTWLHPFQAFWASDERSDAIYSHLFVFVDELAIFLYRFDIVYLFSIFDILATVLCGESTSFRLYSKANLPIVSCKSWDSDRWFFFSEEMRFWSSFHSFEHSRDLSSNLAVGTLSLDHIATENVISQSTNISQDSNLRIKWGHGCGKLEGSMVQYKGMGFGDIHKYVWSLVLLLMSHISLTESFMFTSLCCSVCKLGKVTTSS